MRGACCAPSTSSSSAMSSAMSSSAMSSRQCGRQARAARVVVRVVKNARRLKYGPQQDRDKEPEIITVDPAGSDMWRVARACELLRAGAVGIIPTDTFPAIVVDVQNRDAVLKLYAVKELNPKRPLSILCGSFKDIAHYTAGFPASNQPGQPNWFNTVKKILPGPYTLILAASKNLPSQCVDFMKGKTIHRKSVGVRMPDDRVCQAILEGLEAPLLCTSVHVPNTLSPGTEAPDLGSMLTEYAGKGIDFIVDVGPRVATQSTVVDMSLPGGVVEVLRQGQGDASMFE